MGQFQAREATMDDKDVVVRLFWKAFDAARPIEEIQKEDFVKYWNNNELNEWANTCRG